MVVFLENTTDNNKNEWKRISFYIVIVNGDTVHNPRAFLVSSLAAVPHSSPTPLFSLLFLVSQAFYPPYSLQAQYFIGEIDSSVSLFSPPPLSGPINCILSLANLSFFLVWCCAGARVLAWLISAGQGLWWSGRGKPAGVLGSFQLPPPSCSQE